MKTSQPFSIIQRSSNEYAEDAQSSTTYLEAEKIEGLDDNKSLAWQEYPLDSVFVRTETRTVNEVVRRIDAQRYELAPDFQRDFVWPINKRSRLIESCLMRIPLPVFYLAEAKDGRIIVVDGLQRLTTFYTFIKNEFALSGLNNDKDEDKYTHPLSGKKFDDLALNLQERLEDTQLTLYILDPKAPDRAKLDIFERVNSGVPLTRQQMRNCLYNGVATRWLQRAADSDIFAQTTGNTLNKKSMRDREAINRFCGFYLLGERKYKDMDDFLAETLETMNRLDTQQLDELMEKFIQSMQVNQQLFGKHAFRKSLAYADDERTVINIALFDICSVLFAQLNIDGHHAAVCNTIQALVNDEDFKYAISYSTNSTKQVLARFELARQALQEVLT